MLYIHICELCKLTFFGIVFKATFLFALHIILFTPSSLRESSKSLSNDHTNTHYFLEFVEGDDDEKSIHNQNTYNTYRATVTIDK